MEAEDRAVLKQLGLRFRGRGQWIYFRYMIPGQFPWFLDAGQAELLTSALQNLFMLCKCYMEGKLKPDFDADSPEPHEGFVSRIDRDAIAQVSVSHDGAVNRLVLAGKLQNQNVRIRQHLPRSPLLDSNPV